MTMVFNRPDTKGLRKQLRINQTDVEILLWNRLRAKRFFGVKFFRQYGVGRYILDFYTPGKKVCIELDGGQHASAEGYDVVRTEYLRSFGIRVIRFWNNDVLENIDGVLESVRRALFV